MGGSKEKNRDDHNRFTPASLQFAKPLRNIRLGQLQETCLHWAAGEELSDLIAQSKQLLLTFSLAGPVSHDKNPCPSPIQSIYDRIANLVSSRRDRIGLSDLFEHGSAPRYAEWMRSPRQKAKDRQTGKSEFADWIADSDCEVCNGNQPPSR
jgi:hypothetical protein